MTKFGIVAFSLLAGCATAPTPDQIRQADAGPPPRAEFPEDVKASLKANLRDPDSLTQFTIQKPWKCAYTHPFDPPEYGWCARYTYNAKNGYGGYVGVRMFQVFARNDRLLHWDEIF